MTPGRNGGLIATQFLTVPEAAQRLKIHVDEVFLLILAGVLKAESKGTDSFRVRGQSLEELALLLALSLDKDQSFSDGLQRFLSSVREALSCDQTVIPRIPAPRIVPSNGNGKKALEKAPVKKSMKAKKKLGEILVESRVLRKSQLKKALAKQAALDELDWCVLGELLVELELCDEEDIARALAKQQHLPYCPLASLKLTPEIIDQLPWGLAHGHSIVPVAWDGTVLTIATECSEYIPYIVQDVSFMLNVEVKLAVASKTAIDAALERYYSPEDEGVYGGLMELGSSLEDLVQEYDELRKNNFVEKPKESPPKKAAPPPPLPPLPPIPPKSAVSDAKVSEQGQVDFERGTKTPRPKPKRIEKEHYRAPALPKGKYLRFDEAIDELHVDEEELKRLVSQGELRGFRDGRTMKFKTNDVLNLKQGRETEPSIILTDSDLGLSDDSDELILEDSTSDTVINIGDIVRGGMGDAQEILFDGDLQDFSAFVHPSDPEAAIPDVEVPDIARDLGFDDLDARLVEVGSDGFTSSGFGSDSAIDIASSSSESMETEAFELMEESGEDDGFYAEVRSDAKKRRRRSGALFGLMSKVKKPALPRRDTSRSQDTLTRSGAGKAERRASLGPKTREVEIETVERRTTVRHHKQMYLQQSYPLFVIISQHKIKKLVSVLVDQVSSKKAFKVKKSNPNVRIRPIFPGCLCVPNELDLDVSERLAEAKFFLTPQALGKLEGAKVEILYEGKVVDEIEVDCVATTQALAKLSGSAAFITTSFGPTFESLGKSLSEKGAGWIGELLQMAGSEHGPMITSALLGVLTLLFYLWKKPREAKPIENMFDYEMDSAPQGNPHVMKQKCRLVLLSRAGRQKFELVEEKTPMGRAADCLVTLKERSVAPRHAEINFDPDLQEFSVRPLEGAVKVNGVAVDKFQKLPRDAVIEFGGDVSFWFYDEREDSSGWDRPHIRSKIEQKLLETLGSFRAEIQAAFRNSQVKTVRGVLAVLMVKGILTPKRWALIKKAGGHFLN